MSADIVERLRANVTTPDGTYFLPVCEEAADTIVRLRCILAEAGLQIAYLHGKFEETGSGNAVLARITAEVKGSAS